MRITIDSAALEEVAHNITTVCEILNDMSIADFPNRNIYTGEILQCVETLKALAIVADPAEIPLQ